MDIIVLYLILINALSFVLMLVDKYNAQNKIRRIRESVLLSVAVIGGSFGGFLGMKLVRHKTRHKKFSIGLPILMAAHIALCWHLSNHIPYLL